MTTLLILICIYCQQIKFKKIIFIKTGKTDLWYDFMELISFYYT